MNNLSPVNNSFAIQASDFKTSQIALQEKLAAVQAQVILARQFPRELVYVEQKIKRAFMSLELSEKAEFSLPVAGSIIRGASIRLAEVLAQHYGNLQINPGEVVGGGKDEKGEFSDIKISAWDLESNFKAEQTIRVSHSRYSKAKGHMPINDSGELMRIFSMRTASRLREMIFKVIPVDLKELALKVARETVIKGDGTALIERAKKAIQIFDKYSISKEMLEKKMGMKYEAWTGENLSDLIAIHTSLKDGEGKPADFFEEFAEKDSVAVSSIVGSLQKKSVDNSEPKK